MKTIIRTVSIGSSFRLMGHTFNGLSDLKSHVTFSCSWDSLYFNRAFNETFGREPKGGRLEGIEVVEVYDRYPCFDSYDYANENRYFRDFVLTRGPVTPEWLRGIVQMKNHGNSDLCSEEMPEEYLPLIYYCGEGPVMTVVEKAE